MKAKMRTETLSGYYGPDTGRGRWLFVRSNRNKLTYPIARVVDGQIVELEPEQQLRNYTNEKIANALLAAE